MAKIIMGVATSHSPQLSTPVDQWNQHVERDQSKSDLFYRGKTYSYDELYQVRKSEGLESQVSQEVWLESYDRWEKRIVEVRERIAKVSPDILVVIGDDQRELFLDDGMPALSVFWGDQAKVIPKPKGKIPPSLEPSRWANFGEREEAYDCAPDLGKHIVESFIEQEIDVAQLTEQFQGRGIGHSYIFTRNRLMKKDQPIPMVPIMLNTYFPPNQPTSKRCYFFGKALKKAIESWDSDKTVGIVASGGLSHFVVDEELDRRVMDGLKNKDESLLAAIGQDELMSGTSEIRNWITAGGALEHLSMEEIDYIPAYRSVAGTGCGMGFAWWQ